MFRWNLALVALFIALVAPAPVNAFSAFGPHLGFSSGPDQIILGAHLQFGDVAPQLDFVPGIDLGFGDNLTLISINGDFHYRFDVTGSSWQPYAGAGVGLHFIQYDNNGPYSDGSATEGGGHFILGADVPTKSGSRFFAELKLGLNSRSPDLKVLAGWSFRSH
ncbi:MAG: hypothetical protein ABIU54_13085 [Candidatus Eisenbacteria bacterium]